MKLGEKLLAVIEQFFADTNIRIDKQTNDKFLRLFDTATNVRINLNWEDTYIFLENEDYNFQSLGTDIENNLYIIERIFNEISREQLYTISNKKKFILWGDNINHFTRRVTQGFYKQTEKYAEFIIEIRDEYIYDFPLVSERMIYRFKIEDVDVEISTPSDIFKLIFLQNKFSGFRDEWQSVITLKIYNIKKSEIESIIQQSLFLINLNNFEMFIFGLNIDTSDQPNFDFAKKNSNKLLFPKIRNYEPMAYYNVANYSSIEMRFHYYYKALEFFFRNKSFVSENKSSINEIKKQTELQLLTILLNMTFIKSNIIQIAEQDFFQDMLLRKKRDVSKNIVDIFSDELYAYRNNVVHGGDDTRRLPSLTKGNYSEHTKSIEWWNNTIKELVEVCIKHFCYNDIKIDCLYIHSH